MKNLKRLLSLALAGTILSGMMVMGASAADFTDTDEIVNVEAVDTMVALNIINGNDDGTFAPDRVVSRAEMAKMITVALNGGVDPVLGVKTTPTYTDIKGHWAEKYIEYCSGLGIISGRGNGTFDPAGTVTGTEAAKMMLVAMGYDSTVYNFTGADWDLHVNVEANNTQPYKLYDGLTSLDPSKGLTRDNAAQIIYNGVQSWMMEKSPSLTITNGEITYQYSNINKNSILSTKYGASVFIGTFIGNYNTNAAGTKGEIEVDGKLDTAEATDPVISAYFPSDFDIANIGEEVKVIYKDGKGGRSGQPDKNDTIYGVFNTGATVVVHGATNTSSIANGDDAKGKVKVEGTVYDVAPAGDIIYNYNNSSSSNVHWTDAAMGAQAIEALRNAKNGNAVKLVTDPSTGKVNAAYVVTTDLAVVTSVTAAKVTMNHGVGSITFADNEVYEDIKKDDVVAVTTLYQDKATADGAVTIVEKAETVTGEVTAYKDQKTVSVDGTVYKIYGEANMFEDGIDHSEDAFNSTTPIGDEYTLYMVNGFVRAAALVSAKANNYSVVLEAKTGTTTSVFSGLQLQVMDAEGTKSIITVSDHSDGKTASADGSKGDNTAGINQNDYPRGTIVTYTMNKNGDADVTIEARWNSPADALITYNSKTGVVRTGGTNYAIADNAVLFTTIEAGGISNIHTDVKAYTLGNLGNIDVTKAHYVVTDDNNEIVAIVMDNATTPNGATSNRVYGIISAYNGTTKIDNTEYLWYVADVTDEEQYNIYIKGTDDVGNKLGKGTGKIVSFEPTSDNIYNATALKSAGDVDALANVNGAIDVINTGAGYANKLTGKTLSLWTRVVAKDAAGNVATDINDVAYYDEDDSTLITYAIDTDTKFFYVDADKDEGVASGSVSMFNEGEGYNNILVMWEDEVSGNITTRYIRAVVVETSGDANLIAPATTAAKPVLTLGGTATGSATYNLTSGSKPLTDSSATAGAVTLTATFTGGGASANVTAMTVDGEAFTSGSSVSVVKGTQRFTVVVTVDEIGCSSASYTFTVTITVP